MEYCSICGSKINKDEKIPFWGHSICPHCYEKYLIERNNSYLTKEEAIRTERNIDQLIINGVADERILPFIHSYQNDLENFISNCDDEFIKCIEKEEKILDELYHNKLDIPNKAIQLIPIIFDYLNWLSEKNTDIKNNINSFKRISLTKLKERFISCNGKDIYKEQIEWLAKNNLISTPYLEYLQIKEEKEMELKKEIKQAAEADMENEKKSIYEMVTKKIENQKVLSNLTNEIFGTPDTITDSPNEKPAQNNTSKAEIQIERKIDSKTPTKVTWDTVINKKEFKFAWFISYIGLPINALFTFLEMVMIYQDIPALQVLGIIILLLDGITICGINSFKKYSLISLEILLVFSCVQYFISMLTGSIFGGLIGTFVSIITGIYFIKRKEVYIQ